MSNLRRELADLQRVDALIKAVNKVEARLLPVSKGNTLYNVIDTVEGNRGISAYDMSFSDDIYVNSLLAMLNKLKSEGKLDNPEDKVSLLEELVILLGSMKTILARYPYWKNKSFEHLVRALGYSGVVQHGVSYVVTNSIDNKSMWVLEYKPELCKGGKIKAKSTLITHNSECFDADSFSSLISALVWHEYIAYSKENGMSELYPLKSRFVPYNFIDIIVKEPALASV